MSDKDSRMPDAIELPTFSLQVKRSGEVLRKSASDQIEDYTKRFKSVKSLHDDLIAGLLVSNFSTKNARDTALEFFGSEKVNFAAVDGTEYSRLLFDLAIFFGGAYASRGTLEFSEPPKVAYAETFQREERGLSGCVPIYVNEVPQVDQTLLNFKDHAEASSVRPLTNEAIINNATVANFMMTFSEIFLAYRIASDPKENVRILLLDRSLSNTQTSLTYDTSRRKLWKTNGAIHGFDVDGVEVDDNDMAYGRHRFVNPSLGLPPRRGDYIRYSTLYLLEEEGPMKLEAICTKLGIAERDRRERVSRYLKKSVKEGYLREKGGVYELEERYRSSWQRLRRLVETIGARLFESGSENPLLIARKDGPRWISTQDLAFLTLYCLYMLIEECWKRSILLLGITKDTTATDFKNHLIPVCVNEGLWDCSLSQEELGRVPNTDRMLLQYVSLSNHEKLRVPWSLVEYDSAFQMIVPDFEGRKGYVSGAIRNKIIPEKLFVKTYVQLSEARFDPKLRSNVLFIDRLAYPDFDMASRHSFKHSYGGADEPVDIVLFKNKEGPNPIQNLVMVALKTMTSDNIPEAFGHNKPLFIADKVAKWHCSEFKKIIDSTGDWIMSSKRLRDFVFYMSTFRERRKQIESARRETV